MADKVPKLGGVNLTIGGKTHTEGEIRLTPPTGTGKVSTSSAIKPPQRAVYTAVRSS